MPMFFSIQWLKDFEPTNVAESDLEFVCAEIAAVTSGYEKIQAPVPEWLTDKARTCAGVLATLQREGAMAELKRLELEAQGLKTAQERRNENAAKRAAIRSRLGMPPEATPPATDPTSTTP